MAKRQKKKKDFRATSPLKKKMLKDKNQNITGVPAVAQWDQWHLRSTGTQVQSLAGHHEWVKDPLLP